MTDPARDHGRDADACGGDRHGGGAALRLRGNLPGQVGPWENTPLPGLRRHVDRAIRLSDPVVSLDGGGVAARVAERQVPGIWPARRGRGRGRVGADGQRSGGVCRHAALVEPAAWRSGRGARRRYDRLPLVERRQIHELFQEESHGKHDCNTPLPSAGANRADGGTEAAPFGAAGDLVRALAPGHGGSRGGTSLRRGGGLLGCGGVCQPEARQASSRSAAACWGNRYRSPPRLQEAATRTVWDDARFPPGLAQRGRAPGHGSLAAAQSGAGAGQRDRSPRSGHHRQAWRPGGARAASRAVLAGGGGGEQWDSRRFLDQVCVKAGLHPSSWRDDATTLFIFEGEILRGRLAELGEAAAAGTVRSGHLLQARKTCAPSASFCRDNISAMLSGSDAELFPSWASGRQRERRGL